jgi:hypothetical protein
MPTKRQVLARLSRDGTAPSRQSALDHRRRPLAEGPQDYRHAIIAAVDSGQIDLNKEEAE